MVERIKYCKMCGREIAAWGITEFNWYRFIRLKYCPDCANVAKRLHDGTWKHRQKIWSRKQRTAMKDRIEMLERENEVLRARLELEENLLKDTRYAYADEN